MNQSNIVLQRMLMRVIETLDNPCYFGNLAIHMKALESIINGFERFCVVNIMMDEITEFNEIMHSVNHFNRNVPLDGM